MTCLITGTLIVSFLALLAMDRTEQKTIRRLQCDAEQRERALRAYNKRKNEHTTKHHR